MMIIMIVITIVTINNNADDWYLNKMITKQTAIFPFIIDKFGG